MKKIFLEKTSKIIFYYLVFAGIMDIAERLLGIRHINNLPLLHFYTIIEFLFILHYFKNIFNEKTVNKLVSILSVAFVVLSVLNFVFLQDIHQYNSYPRPIAAIVIILFCLYHIFNQSEKEHKKTWSQYPTNWITIGLLVYFCSSLFYFAFLNLINDTASDTMYFILAYVHATLVLLMYLLFARGFWVYQHER